MKNRYIIGVIGAGNMGSALIKGLLGSQLVRPYEIIASARSRQRLQGLEKRFGVHTTASNSEVIREADTVILGIKPQNMDEVGAEIAPLLTADHLIISIAAGIDVAKLRRLLGTKPRIIRTMPNLPAVIDQGITAIYCGPRIQTRYRRFAHQIFQAVGQTIDVREEKEMDAITALSGTGPAYFFALMEAMQSAGKKLGLSSQVAQALTIQTAVGASLIASQNGADPQELRAQVTSKKGTTWAAMTVFEKRGFSDIVDQAMHAATKRAKELRSLKE